MKNDNFLDKEMTKNTEMITTDNFENIIEVDCKCGCLVEGPSQPHESTY
jgi:hypothetical protein